MILLRRKHLTLLEVMIAFLLIILCVIPLVTPHLMMYREQKRLLLQVNLDHLANRLYAEIYQDLQQGEIPWEVLENEESVPLDRLARRINRILPEESRYQFKLIKPKNRKEGPLQKYLYQLTLSFSWDEQNAQYTYQVFVARTKQTEERLPDEAT